MRFVAMPDDTAPSSGTRHVTLRFPSLGRIVAEQTAVMSTEAAEQFVATSYREKLY